MIGVPCLRAWSTDLGQGPRRSVRAFSPGSRWGGRGGRPSVPPWGWPGQAVAFRWSCKPLYWEDRASHFSARWPAGRPVGPMAVAALSSVVLWAPHRRPFAPSPPCPTLSFPFWWRAGFSSGGVSGCSPRCQSGYHQCCCCCCCWGGAESWRSSASLSSCWALSHLWRPLCH